jgi:ACT domain-containing protein
VSNIFLIPSLPIQNIFRRESLKPSFAAGRHFPSGMTVFFMLGGFTLDNRALVTVLGIDKIGIIAQVTKVLADNRINIVDIRQTILKDFFTMVLVADLKECPHSLGEIQNQLEQLGRDIGVKITLQNEELFRSMHRI